MNHDDIWKKLIELKKERRKILSQCMDEYDSTMYDPTLRQLQEECGKLGHKFVFLGCTRGLFYNEKYSCEYCDLEKRE